MTFTNRRTFLAQTLISAAGISSIAACKKATYNTETTFTWAKRTGTLRVGIANEKPYGYVDSDGNLQGAMVQLLTAILAPYGISHIDAHISDFNALVPSLISNRIDLIGAGMYIRPSRCGSIAFSDPVSKIGGSFLVKKGNPKNLHSLSDVTRQPSVTVGTQPGVDQQQEVVQAGIPESQIVLFSKDTEALAGLQAGRVDAIYFPALEVNALLATSGDSTLERAQPFTQTVFHYQAFGLRNGDTDLLSAVNQSLASLLSSGKLLGMLKVFGYTEADMPPAGVKAAQICSGQQPG